MSQLGIDCHILTIFAIMKEVAEVITCSEREQNINR